MEKYILSFGIDEWNNFIPKYKFFQTREYTNYNIIN